MGGLYGDIAGGLDHLAGSTDEAFARSIDDEPGGGLTDGFAGTLDHLAGSTDEAIGRQFDNEPGGGIGEGVYDTAAGVGDAALGNLDEQIGQIGTWVWVAGGLVLLFALVKAAPDEVSAT